MRNPRPLVGESQKAYLTNDSVAWEIPPGRIARLYLKRAYLPVQGWSVRDSLPFRWRQGEVGEWRNIDDLQRREDSGRQ